MTSMSRKLTIQKILLKITTKDIEISSDSQPNLTPFAEKIRLIILHSLLLLYFTFNVILEVRSKI